MYEIFKESIKILFFKTEKTEGRKGILFADYIVLYGRKDFTDVIKMPIQLTLS